MEPPSGPSRRRCVPWKRLLLAASLLTFWTLPTTTQLSIETVPPLAAEGSNVLLLAHNMTEKTLCYFWYRGESEETIKLIASYTVATNLITTGPAHSGRETLYPNGTLLIQNVTQKDTGSYTLLILKFDLKAGQTGHLYVHQGRSDARDSAEGENSQSSPPGSLPATLTLRKTLQNSAGAWPEGSSQRSSGPRGSPSPDPVPGSRLQRPRRTWAADPVAWPSLQASNTTVAEHEGSVVLTCLTDETGVSICWCFEGQSLLLTRGMTLSLDNSTLTIDPVSRKDAGDYQCEVSNRANSSKSDPLRLHVKYKPTPESSSDLSAGAIVGVVTVAAAGVALIVALVYFLYIRETRRATDQCNLTEHKSSDHNHIHSDSSPEKVNEVEYSSLNFNAQEIKKKATSASPSPTRTETIQK
ncbi:hypothetical protein FD755_003726 [Muntiacus reevesi]|uniref:Ig-like domain-containing protein n=1 Tax=Muntiacus reevesi TaxID=9886 RepID=A0A5J5MNN1_MUNRE|nr:hypothetical protein FD755_003726 [Muntiacus reevesi]